MVYLHENTLTLYMLGNFHAFVVAICFFQEHYPVFAKGLDPDQDRCSVGPDLGPNCLQRLPVDNKSCG